MENPLEMWRNTVEILKYYGNTMEIPRKYMEILYGNTIYIYIYIYIIAVIALH